MAADLTRDTLAMLDVAAQEALVRDASDDAVAEIRAMYAHAAACVRAELLLRELHMPIPRAHQDGGGEECAVCYDSDGVPVSYPCPTIRLLPAAATTPEAGGENV